MKSLFRLVVCFSIFCMAVSSFSEVVSEYDKAMVSLDKVGEVVYRTNYTTDKDLDYLSTFLVVDNFDASYIYLWSGRTEFEKFVALDRWFDVPEQPWEHFERMERLGHNVSSRRGNIQTPQGGAPYSGFKSMVEGLESDYSEICKTSVIGKNSKNQEIYLVKVSNNPSENQAKPLFIGTGTMHGNEVTGMMSILFLIEWLGKNYKTDPQAKALVENIEMYFIPLVNPGGTYNSQGKYGNLRRAIPEKYQNRDVDVNRSFEVPSFSNSGPDYPGQWNEKMVMVNLFNEKSFSVGFDLHTGMESVVLPWSCTKSDMYKHPDFDGFFMTHSSKFSSKVGGLASGYGWAYKKWYQGFGTIFDWSACGGHCRDFCVEMGSQQGATSGTINKRWEKFKPGLIYLMEQTMYGIHGTVYCDGKPVKAKIEVDNWDQNNSHMYSNPATGYFVRPIQSGTRSLTISYESYTIKVPNVSVKDGEKTDIGHIEMTGTSISKINNSFLNSELSVKSSANMVVLYNGSKYSAVFELYTLNGSKVKSIVVEKGSSSSFSTNSFSYSNAPGVYLVSAKNKISNHVQRITIK